MTEQQQGVITAVAIFHRTADIDAFERWARELCDTAVAAEGFVSSSTSVRDFGLDWAVAVSFTSEALLHEWLDGARRRAVLEAGQSQGFWCLSTDLILGEDVSVTPGVCAFRHFVTSGKEAEFRVIQERLAAATARFPGYLGTVLLPPATGLDWLSVLRFRTAEQLTAWLSSPERDDALPGVRSSVTRGFASVSSTTPFGTTVRVQDGRTLMTPKWKSAMLVLLVLYPTVLVLARFFAPLLRDAGMSMWLTLWVGQIASVSALTWLFMPVVTRAFRRWLDPVDGAGVRIGLVGTAAVLAGYAATLAVFGSIRWLQYWD